MERVVILGAGFGGLELATRLSDEVPDTVEVVLIDQSDSFVFGYSKLDVMFGRQTAESARLYYRDIVKPSVEFRQESVVAIDPANRRVTTDANTYDADVLVVALGADLAPELTPGLVEGGNEFYSVAGAERSRHPADVRRGRRDHRGARRLLQVPGRALRGRDDAARPLDQRGVRDATTIKVLTPMGMPIPISQEASAGIIAGLEARGIEFWPETVVASLDPATHLATLRDGRTINYDLFLGVPIHRRRRSSRNPGSRSTAGFPSITRRSPRSSRTSTRSATSRARRCRASA